MRKETPERRLETHHSIQLIFYELQIFNNASLDSFVNPLNPALRMCNDVCVCADVDIEFDEYIIILEMILSFCINIRMADTDTGVYIEIS